MQLLKSSVQLILFTVLICLKQSTIAANNETRSLCDTLRVNEKQDELKYTLMTGDNRFVQMKFGSLNTKKKVCSDSRNQLTISLTDDTNFWFKMSQSRVQEGDRAVEYRFAWRMTNTNSHICFGDNAIETYW